MNDKSFDGQVAVVTGGASGIGRSIAEEFARRGAAVAIADIHAARLEETVASLEAIGADALGVSCDVTSDEQVGRLHDAVIERFGQVDVLCNNAGIATLGPAWRVEMDDWQRVLDVNVLGLVRGVRAFVPAMVDRGSGYVVNTASVAGIWAYSWGTAPYVTSKFAAYGYSEALARCLRPRGVGVSVLCPGRVATNLGESATFSGVPEGRIAEWAYFPPEMGEPIDVDIVGPLVADAITAGTFAIFTHEQDAELFRTWRDDIDKSLADAIASSPPPPQLPRTMGRLA
jgi:NAD(P)-dependent dehydrogenase (short-subunit alcohol dehydrogenase family)